MLVARLIFIALPKHIYFFTVISSLLFLHTYFFTITYYFSLQISGCSGSGFAAACGGRRQRQSRKKYRAMRSAPSEQCDNISDRMLVARLIFIALPKHTYFFTVISSLLLLHTYFFTITYYFSLQISGCSAAGSAPALGAGCREFESLHSDHC